MWSDPACACRHDWRVTSRTTNVTTYRCERCAGVMRRSFTGGRGAPVGCELTCNAHHARPTTEHRACGWPRCGPRTLHRWTALWERIRWSLWEAGTALGVSARNDDEGF